MYMLLYDVLCALLVNTAPLLQTAWSERKVISEFRVVETGSTSVQPLIILYLLQNEELASMANERGSAEAAQFFLQYQVSLSCVSDYPLWP